MRTESSPIRPSRGARVRALSAAACLTVADMAEQHVVVDGSNIATEGRSLPSLAQLEDAVAELRREMPDATVTVVVDATFAHRIDPTEHDRFEQAALRGEFVYPPAGAIGRGDAFLLRIAERVDAIVLSNDSFQEFHGEHPWLFERGRLLGATPVPGVGWIFVPRTPVRGPRSRVAVRDATRSKQKVERAIAEATREVVAPAADVEQDGEDGEPVASGRRRRSPATTAPAVNDPTTFISFIAEHRLGEVIEAEVESFTSHGAVARYGELRCYVPLSGLGSPPPRSAREVLRRGETRGFAITALDPFRRGVELALPEVAVVSGHPSEETVAAEKRMARRHPAGAAGTRPAAGREVPAPREDAVARDGAGGGARRSGRRGRRARDGDAGARPDTPEAVAQQGAPGAGGARLSVDGAGARAGSKAASTETAATAAAAAGTGAGAGTSARTRRRAGGVSIVVPAPRVAAAAKTSPATKKAGTKTAGRTSAAAKDAVTAASAAGARTSARAAKKAGAATSAAPAAPAGARKRAAPPKSAANAKSAAGATKAAGGTTRTKAASSTKTVAREQVRSRGAGGRRCGEGRCGEGRCGEGRCDEGRCGEGRGDKGRCGEGRCGEGRGDDDRSGGGDEGRSQEDGGSHEAGHLGVHRCRQGGRRREDCRCPYRRRGRHVGCRGEEGRRGRDVDSGASPQGATRRGEHQRVPSASRADRR